jgi:vacuolar iron transporter family protein
LIGGDSDTSASIKRREFVPFASTACLAAVVSTTKVIVAVGLAEIVASAIATGLGGYLAGRTGAEHCAAQKAREYWEIDNLRDKMLRNSDD